MTDLQAEVTDAATALGLDLPTSSVDPATPPETTAPEETPAEPATEPETPAVEEPVDVPTPEPEEPAETPPAEEPAPDAPPDEPAPSPDGPPAEGDVDPKAQSHYLAMLLHQAAEFVERNF